MKPCQRSSERRWSDTSNADHALRSTHFGGFFACSRSAHPAHKTVICVLMWHLGFAIIAAQPCAPWQLLRVAQAMYPPELFQLDRFAGLYRQGAGGAINLDLGDHVVSPSFSICAIAFRTRSIPTMQLQYGLSMYTCGSRHVGDISLMRCNSSAESINITCPRVVQCAPQSAAGIRPSFQFQ